MNRKIKEKPIHVYSRLIKGKTVIKLRKMNICSIDREENMEGKFNAHDEI